MNPKRKPPHATRRKQLEPIHPGEILLEDFMKPLGVSINRLARDLVVPPGQVSDAQGRAKSCPTGM